MNLGLPRARDRRAHARGARAPAASRRSPNAIPGGCPAARRQLVGIASLLAMRPRHLDPRRADSPARPRRDAARRRGARARWRRPATSLLIAEHKTDLLDGLCVADSSSIDGGRIVAGGPAGRGLRRPAPRGARRRATGARCGSSRALTAAGSTRRSLDARAGARDDLHARTSLVSRLPGRHPRARRASTCPSRAGERVAIVGQNGSRQVDARPPPQRPAPPDRGPGARSTAPTPPVGASLTLAATRRPRRSRTRTARSSPGRSAPRSRSGRATSGCRGRGAATRPSSGAGGRRSRPTSDERTRTTSATRAGSCSRSPRSSRWTRRSWSSTSRRPARTPAASQRVQRIVGDVAARGPDRHRDQPRHAVRRRRFERVDRHARRPDRPRRQARGVFAEANWPTLASTYLEPPLPARVGARSSGLGSTPTDALLIERLAAQPR